MNPKKFQKHIEPICQIVKQNLKKNKMIMTTFRKLHAQIQASKRISILQLQAFKNKNRIKEHWELVHKMK